MSKSVALRTQSLANKYRPKKLEQLVGQDEVVQKIRGILKKKNVPSAFLLTGGTGTGKSTVARMLARYLNCTTMDACGTCENCKLWLAGIHPDFEEINLSSARGIDDIRSMVRRAQNKPRVGALRVIFCDESHSITPQAAEAWLVPLESPPPQTLWILATTNPEKLPKTILGRCTPLKLQLISKELVSQHLKKIAHKEGIEVKSKIRDKIAELTGGYMRNAILALESVKQVMDSGDKVTTEGLIRIVESASAEGSDSKQEEAAMKMLCALYKGSVKSLWKYSAPVNSDYVGFVNKMLWLNQFMLESTLIGRGPTVWYTPLNLRFKDMVKSLDFNVDTEIKRMASLQSTLADLRGEIITVSGFDRPLILGRLSSWIENNRLDKGDK